MRRIVSPTSGTMAVPDIPTRSATRSSRQRFELPRSRVERLQRAPRVGEQALTGVGQRDPARRAIEQPHAHARLELPDLRRERLLRDEQPLARPA